MIYTTAVNLIPGLIPYGVNELEKESLATREDGRRIFFYKFNASRNI